jgi:protein-S-isoprenylcysteine O-methyltransferase Ste14
LPDGAKVKQFDPFGWLEKYISAHRLHFLIRVCIIVALTIFLIHRINQYNLYLVKPLWVVETIIFVVFIVSYALRIEPVERSRGVKEIIIPLSGGVLPFTLLFSVPANFLARNPLLIQIIFYWMTATTAFTIWSLWTIRRSFSITVEARALVKSGPYRWIRHPVYLGEIFTALAVAIWRFSVLNIAFIVLFVAIQLYRARLEEVKLGRNFPDYSVYACRAKWLWQYKK